MRKNINITLEEELISKIDTDVKNDTFRSRSHALQKIVREYYLQENQQ
jgi:metal-responsive CopG/Arc/MetJ family transcriptional regulator